MTKKSGLGTRAPRRRRAKRGACHHGHRVQRHHDYRFTAVDAAESDSSWARQRPTPHAQTDIGASALAIWTETIKHVSDDIYHTTTTTCYVVKHGCVPLDLGHPMQRSSTFWTLSTLHGCSNMLSILVLRRTAPCNPI